MVSTGTNNGTGSHDNSNTINTSAAEPAARAKVVEAAVVSISFTRPPAPPPSSRSRKGVYAERTALPAQPRQGWSRPSQALWQGSARWPWTGRSSRLRRIRTPGEFKIFKARRAFCRVRQHFRSSACNAEVAQVDVTGVPSIHFQHWHFAERGVELTLGLS